MSSNIEWTDLTENPIYLKNADGGNGGHWCRKHSEGCANCYAETINQSNYFSFASHLPYSGKAPPTLTFDRRMSQKWASAKISKKRFICSMTDLFGEWVPLDWQFSIFDAAAAAPSQIIQLLTKRPEIALAAMQAWIVDRDQPLPGNIWMGTSIENQRTANLRLPIAMQFPCQVRWLSVEPLLDAIDLTQAMYGDDPGNSAFGFTDGFGHEMFFHQVIVGGESGSGARECSLSWIEDLVDQCGNGEGVPVFVKQVGTKSVGPDKFGVTHKISRKGGDIQQFPTHLQYRQYPRAFYG